MLDGRVGDLQPLRAQLGDLEDDALHFLLEPPDGATAAGRDIRPQFAAVVAELDPRDPVAASQSRNGS